MKCLINEQQCFFSGVKSPAEAKASDFRLNKKIVLRVYKTTSKTFLERHVSTDLITTMLL